MHNILVTSIGSASAEGVITHLKKENNYIVGTNIYDKENTYCSVLVDVFYTVSRSDSDQYIYEIINICLNENVNYIIPLTDLEIDAFNNNRELLNKNGLIVCFSGYETIKICRDKRLSSELVRSLNVCYVPSIFQDNGSALDYPIICKKISGRSSEGIKILRTQDDYDAFEKNLNNEYFIQKYIEGNIITVDLLRFDDFVVSISREELVRTVNGLGISVRTFYDEKLELIVKAIANALNVFGCVNFEFIKTDRGYFFLECNPRFSGGVNYSLLSGYDFVLNHLHCFSKSKVENICNTKEQVINRKYTDIIYCGD